MACEDPNYRITLRQEQEHQGFSYERALTYAPSVNERMEPKTNFFGETMEVPAGHNYATQGELGEARI